MLTHGKIGLGLGGEGGRILPFRSKKPTHDLLVPLPPEGFGSHPASLPRGLIPDQADASGGCLEAVKNEGLLGLIPPSWYSKRTPRKEGKENSPVKWLFNVKDETSSEMSDNPAQGAFCMWFFSLAAVTRKVLGKLNCMHHGMSLTALPCTSLKN